MIQRTFFNSRKERLYWNYTDTNSYLFTIIFNSDAELNLILRNLKKDNHQ